MSIKLLNKETIQLINSTQIITSIYSAVKELVENSLDAQAQNIEINLVNNGLSLIEVKDNGSGISKVDAQYMALPSHTSKISSFHDLDLLSTYGFRGEGLTAICKVSDVTICTKTANDETMTCYSLNNEGYITNSEFSHGLIGTSVKMKNLFKNIPVRRNMLNDKKRINHEIKLLEMLLKSYAICHYSIRFIYKLNSDTIFTKSNCKNIFEALKSVLGMQIFSKLSCIEKSFAETTIQLFVPTKDMENSTEMCQVGFQFVFINNRPIQSKAIEKLINKRISQFFNKCNSHNQKFIFYLGLKVDSSMLDVNLEPNKDKVFLKNEATVLCELDKSLINFYKLTNLNVSTQNDIENINFNENLNEINKNKIKEQKSPICKKRKICENDSMNKPENSFFKNISELMLSDSDSNDVDELVNKENMENNECNALEVQNIHIKNNNELSDFAKSVLTKEQFTKETLSQLPQVDLGEDFDWNELNKNNKSSNIETSNSQQISDVTWSKGQISGLKNGTTINHDTDTINNLNVKEKNLENQDSPMEDSELFDFNTDIDQINDSQELACSNDKPIVKIEEFDWKLIKNNSSKTIDTKINHKLSKNSLNASFDRTQTKIAFAGSNTYLSNQPSAFALYCSSLRTKFVKQHPELTPTEVAIYMNQKWKEISSEEREYYRDLANQQIHNTSHSLWSQKFRKTKNEPSQCEKDKNKKHFVSMLGNMKKNKTEGKSGSVIMRTFISWNINTSLVAEKFRKPIQKIEKSIVGSLNSLLWILNLSSKLFVFDITELQIQLNMKPLDMAEINIKNVQNLVDQWFINKNDMSIFHHFHSCKM